MRAVVAIAEQSDDKLKNMCLETIAELSMCFFFFLLFAGRT